MQPSEEPDMLLVSEVQRRLRLSRNGTYEAIGRGEIPSIRIGRRILVPRLALEEMLTAASRRAAGAA
jgi:excisionase family DNA binding protein